MARALQSYKSKGLSPRRRSNWGGARNNKNRRSWYLSPKQATMLQRAFARSIELGMPFNRHWTVHHERAGIPNEDGAGLVGRLLDPARRYCRRRDRFAAAWVRENGDGKGCHVHIAMHVPEAAQLRGNTRRWIERAGGVCRKGVSVVKVIGGTLAASRVGGPFYEANAEVLLGYFLKGVEADFGEEHGLELYGEGGLIIGKRAGRTQNLR